MKKIILFLFSLIIIFSIYCGINANADSVSVTLESGARIRTEGLQGLRFEASINSLDNVSEHGFFLALGNHSYDDIKNAANSNANTINGKTLLKKSTNGSELRFAVTVYDIPLEEYGNSISVIAYCKISDVYYFSSICVSRNVIEVARNAYFSGNNQEFIEEIVDSTKVKVTSGGSNIKYYNDLDDVNLNNGDIIELSRFTYSGININKNNVSIYGLNKDINEERINESIITSSINIADGVSNCVINGCKFECDSALVLNGNNDNLEFSYNICDYTSNECIKDVNNSSIHNNLFINNNLFNGSNNNYQKAIYLNAYISGANRIENNKFKDSLVGVKENGFAIKLDKYKADTYLQIKNNEFSCYGANYLIDLGYGMGSNGDILERCEAYINIENNKMSDSSTKSLQGNGIRISYLSSDVHINISHNYNFKTSTFYNHILLSSGISAGSTLEEYPEVNIVYNQFYVDALPGASGNEIDKPSVRTKTPSKAYIRIGLGLPDEGSGEDYHVNITNNYFDASTSRMAYTDISSADYVSNTNQVQPASVKYTSVSECDSGYSAYRSKYDNLENAIMEAKNNNIVDGYQTKLGYYNGSLIYEDTNDMVEKVIVAVNSFSFVDDMRDYYKSLIHEVAYDFYYQKTQIQYDQYNSRRNVNSNPDDATAYRGIYLDCSSYVNSVYHYVFNTNISNYTTQSTANFEAYSKNGGRSGDVIYYCDTTVTRTSDEKNAILNEVKDMLEVGDVVNYRHGGSSTGGHVMLYIGNDMFLHCTGSSLTSGTKTDGSFDPTTITSDGTTSAERSGGAIQLLNASEVFSNTSSKRYLFYTDQTSFSVIRPLNRDLTPTLSACNKTFMQALTFEKIASSAHMSSVNRGEEITYTINIKNNSNVKVGNINVSDVVSSYCSYKDASITNDGIVNGNNVSWNNLSVPASSYITLSYTVKVKNDVEIGTIINSNDTKVNNVGMNKMYHIVSEYSDSDLNTLVTKAKTFIGNSTYTDDFKLFDDIYFETFNKHLDSSIRTSQAAIEALIDLSNNTKYTNTDLSDMLVCDLYGGLAIKDEMPSNNDRIRLIRDSYLEAGDIIVLYNKKTNTYKSYMYLGASEDKMISINNGTVSVVYIGTELDTFLIQVFAYSRFGVIRPSLSMWNN